MLHSIVPSEKLPDKISFLNKLKDHKKCEPNCPVPQPPSPTNTPGPTSNPQAPPPPPGGSTPPPVSPTPTSAPTPTPTISPVPIPTQSPAPGPSTPTQTPSPTSTATPAPTQTPVPPVANFPLPIPGSYQFSKPNVIFQSPESVSLHGTKLKGSSGRTIKLHASPEPLWQTQPDACLHICANLDLRATFCPLSLLGPQSWESYDTLALPSHLQASLSYHPERYKENLVLDPCPTL